jgi:hypothetical protein
MSPYAGSSGLSGNLVGEPSDPHPQQLSGLQVEREAEVFFLTAPSIEQKAWKRALSSVKITCALEGDESPEMADRRLYACKRWPRLEKPVTEDGRGFASERQS